MRDTLALEPVEVLRERYRAHRYARHLSQVELNGRIRDIFLNLVRVSSDGKVGPPPTSATLGSWLKLWTEVLEESRLRHGPFPAGMSKDVLHSEPFPDFAGELADKAARALRARGFEPGTALMKYGQRRFMEDLIFRGAVRIQPATFFRVPAHNGAVRDDELALSLSFAMDAEDAAAFISSGAVARSAVHRADVNLKWYGDYWLCCLSEAFEPRLFVDFNADACVIIRNRHAFAARLRDAASKALSGAVCREGGAIYIDPLLPTSLQVFVPAAKHFRYAYQAEYRFAWIPAVPTPQLTHVDVAIGSQEDSAELVVL